MFACGCAHVKWVLTSCLIWKLRNCIQLQLQLQLHYTCTIPYHVFPTLFLSWSAMFAAAWMCADIPDEAARSATDSLLTSFFLKQHEIAEHRISKSGACAVCASFFSVAQGTQNEWLYDWVPFLSWFLPWPCWVAPFDFKLKVPQHFWLSSFMGGGILTVSEWAPLSLHQAAHWAGPLRAPCPGWHLQKTPVSWTWQADLQRAARMGGPVPEGDKSILVDCSNWGYHSL